MKKTKQKIIQSSIELFNQKGWTNVRLQDIADRCGISVGNLAYHYSNKAAILQAIDELIQVEIEPVLSKERQFPSLLDFDNQLSCYFFLVNKFAFYFLDLLELERNHPNLHKNRQRYIHEMTEQIESWMGLCVSKGVIQPAIQENQYHYISQAIWMIITFWMTQQQVKGNHHQDEGEFKTVVWNQLLPVFTPLGLMEYEAMILPNLKNLSALFHENLS